MIVNGSYGCLTRGGSSFEHRASSVQARVSFHDKSTRTSLTYCGVIIWDGACPNKDTQHTLSGGGVKPDSLVRSNRIR